MDIKELIEKAVENLNRVRQLNLSITDMPSQPDNDNVFLAPILDNESDCTFYVVIDENMSTQQLLSDEPANLSPYYNTEGKIMSYTEFTQVHKH